MRIILYLILLLLLLTLKIKSDISELQCDEKIEFVNKVLENPEDFEKILKNSPFYSKNEFQTKYDFKRIKWKLEMYYPQKYGPYIMIQSFNISINSSDKYYDTHSISFIYFGDKSKTLSGITFTFEFVDNKWIFKKNLGNGHEDIFSEKSKDFYDKFRFDSTKKFDYFRTLTEVPEGSNIYINRNYQFCEKYEFINELLDAIKNDVHLNDYKFGIPIKVDVDTTTFFEIIKEYLQEFQNYHISTNYPFPYSDKDIQKYLDATNKTDYYILNFGGLKHGKRTLGHLTFKFEEIIGIWYFSEVFKGTDIYRGITPGEGHQYELPWKK